MDKVYRHQNVEEEIYQTWEKAGYFTPHPLKAASGQAPFTIILPPPNANGDLHFGHAMFVIEDILVRFHRMRGEPTLWLPGVDHAGFETQFVFEKKLEKEGKSRLDFDRETLYRLIWDFSQHYRPIMERQLRRLGFSLDWTRKKFTLDENIIKIVYKTFKKLYDNGLVYRGERLVNYCTHCGTSFSDLEVNHRQQRDPLYYLKYGPFVLATVRPETKFGDTAVAVNPADKQYKKWIGKTIEAEGLLGKFKIKVIGDLTIDPKFGTGVAKVTPAHDMKDFEIGKRHNLDIVRVIDFDGKLNERAGKYKGLTVKEARKIIAKDLQKKGLIEKVDENYTHTIEACYKCQTTIEPMLLPQWFVRMEPLRKPAIEVVKKGKIRIFPKRFEKIYFQFLENIRDWNISRQIVWGIRIPAWQCQACKIKNQKSKIKNTTQNSKVSNNIAIQQFNNESWVVTEGEKPEKCPHCGSKDLKQDPDTFDTWFSSAQWPFATLQSLRVNPSSQNDFAYFYPTSVMETGYEILRWWVARMIMVGLYVTGKVPFKHVVLHGMVKDPYGKKMSKSKGNVVNPLEIIEQYGADSIRMALVYGTALGNDQSLSYPKLQAMRNFTNKLWNMGRFIEMKRVQSAKFKVQSSTGDLLKLARHGSDREMIKQVKELVRAVTNDLENYNFNHAAETLYDFIWHTFADKYIEDVKDRLDSNVSIILNSLFMIQLQLLHPFMPFVTEEIYQRLGGKESLMILKWPIFPF